MRVLHLTISAARGGRRDAILTLIEHLRQGGVECGLVALRNTSTEVAEFAPRVDYLGGLDLATRPTLAEMATVIRICRERKVDVIHAHDAGSQYVASMLRFVAPRIRVVMTFHRTLGIDSEGFHNRLRNALLLPFVHRVVTASEERRAYFISKTLVAPTKVEVIPNGIDLTRYRPDITQRNGIRAELGLAPETTLILAVGHFGIEKGLDQVLEGVARGMPEYREKPWHLVILGTGPVERITTLRALSQRLFGARATLPGFRTDVARWLQAGDLLVHAPRMEAFGLAVIQALACGLPVVATSVGGLPEIVEHGVTGHLVAPGDLTALGAAVATVMGDPVGRCRMGAAALARARDCYDARQMAVRHVALYHQLIGGSSRATALRAGGSDAAAESGTGLNAPTNRAPHRWNGPPWEVVHCVFSIAIGGQEVVILSLASHTNRALFTPRVLCFKGAGALAPRFEAQGIPVDVLDSFESGGGFGTLRALRRYLRNRRPAILHTHNPTPHQYGAIARLAAGVPVLVHTKHGRNQLLSTKARLLERLAGHLTDAVVAVSRDAANVALSLDGVPARRLRVIHNGVAIGDVPPNAGTQAGWRVVHVARLDIVKDQATLLRAARLVLDREPRFRLDIVGDGALRPELETLANTLSLGDAVRFHGFQDDVRPFLEASDVFVLSSVSEGIAMTLLEAMAARLPVVATDVGGNSEVVVHDETGVLVAAGDPAALAEGLLRVLGDRALAKRMGLAGRERVATKFALQTTVDAYESVYLQLLQRRFGGARAS